MNGINKPCVLFVCGRNRLRSPTAERIYRHDARLEVRSAGMSAQATHVISPTDVEWADLILVMESKYAADIRRRFRSMKLPSIRSLDIPDEYDFMDEELVELLQGSVESEIARLIE